VQKIRNILLYLTGAVILYGAGWYSHDYYNHNVEHTKLRRISAKGFQFTSPLLDVEFPEGMGVNYEPLPFKHKVDAYLKKQISSGFISDASVYYRDLLNGPWFGINENKEFDPASMMKVAVMVAWLKRAEKNPQLLQQTMTYNYQEDLRAIQDIKPGRSIEPGRSYSVDELLRFMMNYSDNNATRLLYEQISTDEFNEILSGMDVDSKMHDGIHSMTVHGYSGLFRILHNASYLNREMSEKALKLLSLQDFPQGIIAGVPKGIVVSSKYGETAEGPSERNKQLHEFGIVYHPKHRYIVGIMTKGSDYGRMAQVIQGVSKIIYDEVDAGTFTPDDVSR
jgi:beta-lactamase class A